MVDPTGGQAAFHPFRAAIEARDVDAAVALLSDDVVFRSPVVFKPYHGRDAVRPIVAAASRVFEDFRYVRDIGAPDARDHALVFPGASGIGRSREATFCTSAETAQSMS